MNRLFLTAAFLFVLGACSRRLNRECRRRSRRSHSHRARNDAMRTAGQDREGGRKPRLERAKTQGFAANRAGRALICHIRSSRPLVTLSGPEMLLSAVKLAAIDPKIATVSP